MSAMMANFISKLFLDGESAESAHGIRPDGFFFADIRGQASFVDGFAERFEFLFLSLDSQFHTSIGQIPHRAGHFIMLNPVSRQLVP